MNIPTRIASQLNQEAGLLHRQGFQVENIEDEVVTGEEIPNVDMSGVDLSLFGSEESLGKNRELIQRTMILIKELFDSYQRKLLSLIDEYSQSNPNMTPRIRQFLIEHGMTTPTFEIYDADTAANRLRLLAEKYTQLLQQNRQLLEAREENGFYYGGEDVNRDSFFNIKDIADGSILIVFKLPKPLDQFWSKGHSESKEGNVSGMALEWGQLYEKSLPEVWKVKDRAIEYGLDLYRVNADRVHDPLQFYYIWEASVFEQLDN